MMEYYDGNLYNLYEKTMNNPVFTAKLLLKIAQALHQLQILEFPIYHRDLKPDNILYKQNGENIELYLTDFGIAYLDDERLERKTKNWEAIGARHFIAPEYELGKVEIINEKGDIYSLGKILWCMINGDVNEYLPSNFWYIDDYDLKKKCLDKKISIVNMIISKCLEINPNDRLNYEQLKDYLKLIIEEKELEEDEFKKLKIIEYEQKNKLIKEKSAEEIVNFVNVFLEIFEQAFTYIRKKYDTSPSIQKVVINEIRFRRKSKQNKIARCLIDVGDIANIKIIYIPYNNKDKCKIDLYVNVLENSTIYSLTNNKNLILQPLNVKFDINVMIGIFEEMIDQILNS